MAVNIQRSIFPLDWDSKCSDKSFNDWHQHIKDELKEIYFRDNPLVKRERSQEERISDARGQVFTLQLAKRILRNGN